MRRLMTGVLVAALLISQTSIADVFVKTDAATVMAAGDDAQSGDEAEAVTEDADLDADASNSQTEVDDVEGTVEEVTPDEDTEPEEEVIPENPEVVPGPETPETEEEEQDEDVTEETEEEEDLMAEDGIMLLDAEAEEDGEDPNQSEELGTRLDPDGAVFDEESGIAVWYKAGEDSTGVLTIIVNNDKFSRDFPDFSPRNPEEVPHEPQPELMTMDLDGADAEAPAVPWKDYLTDIVEVKFVGRNNNSTTDEDGNPIDPIVTHIGDYMFNGCSSLTAITIPSGVTSIGKGAFMGCTQLPSITIPSGVTEISDYAFADCMGLGSVTIPSGVTAIGNGAFTGCEGLNSVTVQGNVTTIGDNAFYNCGTISSIDMDLLLLHAESIGSSAFAGSTSVTYGSTGEIAFTKLKSLGGGAFDGITNLSQVMYQENEDGTLEGAFNSLRDQSIVQIQYGPSGDGIEITKIARADNNLQERSVIIYARMAGKDVVSVDPNYRKYVKVHGGVGHEPVLDEENAQKTEATCTENGSITAVCLICGEEETETLEASGHKFTGEWCHDDKEHWKECSVCGEESDHEAHTVPGTSCDVCDKYTQSGKDPNQPGGEDPNQPGGEDPNQPGNTPVTPQPTTPPATGGNNGGGSGSGSSSSGSSSAGTTSNQSSSANAATSAPAETTTVITYTVEPGDTLSKIALKYYGSSSYWTKIYADNADTIKDPNKIYVGQILKIYLTQNNGAATAEAPVAGTNYTVVSGDSLSKIAQKVYGQSGQWRKIYDANTGTISEPNRIYVGQVIVIPE